MRFLTAFRLLTLLSFALFGGALPVAASGEHVVICGADGVKRIVAYDFETGQPVEAESAVPECQDCFGLAPLLILAIVFSGFAASGADVWPVGALTATSRPDIGLPPVRAPPSLIA